MKLFIIDFLNKEGCDYQIQKDKLVISDEFQIPRMNEELGFESPYFLTEWQYPASLNSTLSDFNNVLDEKFGRIFECDYDGTFSIILED